MDPLEPPKFRVKKVPRGPGSPPVPVMHSPPRPATKAELDDWKIPPSVSNWKNPKGYIIPLDKRLAADGRGLQSTLINDKFAAFQESLAITGETQCVPSREMTTRFLFYDKSRMCTAHLSNQLCTHLFNPPLCRAPSQSKRPGSRCRCVRRFGRSWPSGRRRRGRRG